MYRSAHRPGAGLVLERTAHVARAAVRIGSVKSVKGPGSSTRHATYGH